MSSNRNSSSSAHHHHQHHQSSSPQQSSGTIPQSLKLTDYLRPVFQESNMIREYCLFAQIQRQMNPTDGSMTASQDGLNNSGQAKLLTGLYVIPSATSSYLWFGVLCINNDRSSIPSPWHSGVFRFFIRFPENYPTSGWPNITFLPTTCQSHPLLHSSQSSQQQQQQPQTTTITTHPDINPTTGQFNVRAYLSNTSSSSTHVPRTYKILRLVRKSFYRQFTDVEVQNSVNPSAAEMCARDYQEFLRNCAIDAAESLKFLRETDRFICHKFKNDSNLILLGGEGERRTVGEGGATQQQQQSNGVGGGGGAKKDSKTIGLSFML